MAKHGIWKTTGSWEIMQEIENQGKFLLPGSLTGWYHSEKVWRLGRDGGGNLFIEFYAEADNTIIEDENDSLWRRCGTCRSFTHHHCGGIYVDPDGGCCDSYEEYREEGE